MHEVTVVLTLLLTLFVVTYLSQGSKITRDGQPLRRPPHTLPIAGNGIKFLQDRHRLFSWFVKCEQIFGFETFEISVPSLPPGVVINDPRNLEYVLKNHGVFSKGDFFKTRSWDLFGDGIINVDGDLWKVLRKAGLHFLSVSNLKFLTDIALPRYLGKTIRALESSLDNVVIDLEDVFLELNTQLMGKMAYNMDIHNSDPFSAAFDFASGKTGERFQNPLWQITEKITGSAFRKSIKEVKAFGKKIVLNAVASRHAQRTGLQDEIFDGTSGSLIYSLLDVIDDHQIVADAALNYLSAGRDTTAQALTWTFYLLMRNPHVVKGIRKEISTLATLDDILEPARFQSVSMPYTTAVFYEAVRLYPPVPFELKQCEQATTLPDGTFLPKGAILIWCTWAMNRSQLIWGPESDVFEPERWLHDGKFVSKTAYEYPAFNGGHRTCLGKKMAEVVAVQSIATLLSKFDFEPVDHKERITKNSLTLPMEDGLPCYVKLRPEY
ncbi:cytochrome P450 [Bisporella sp. PMI_857]|nr:cytochrome P450 [Bisporella sp. PMI_857]